MTTSLADQIAYAVVDIETTGLEALADVPLELGIILTDKDGLEIGSMSWLIWETSPMFQFGVARGKSNHFVNKMHTDNGLWLDVQDKGYSRNTVDEKACQWLRQMGAKPMSREDGAEFDGLGMMGNSTGSLDRPFSLVHFPRLNAYLGYRNIDMSSIKEVCKRNNPDLYAQLKPIIGDKSKAPHRVLGDARACILEFQTYLDEFLIVAD